MLAVDGVNCAFSLPLDEDQVSLSLQELAIDLSSSPTWASSKGIEVALSDGACFSPMFFSSYMLSIIHLLSVSDVCILFRLTILNCLSVLQITSAVICLIKKIAGLDLYLMTIINLL